MESSSVRCARCQSSSHSSNACHLPFYRKSAMEEREERLKRRAEWAARQAEKAEKQAAWESKEAERKAKQADIDARSLAWKQQQVGSLDTKCNYTDDIDSTAASSVVAVDEEEVERMSLLDKDVRKCLKVLRDIEKLESRHSLDALQKEKVARKHEVQRQLIVAKGLAK